MSAGTGGLRPRILEGGTPEERLRAIEALGVRGKMERGDVAATAADTSRNAAAFSTSQDVLRDLAIIR